MSTDDEFFAALELQEEQRPLGKEQRCKNCAYWESQVLEKISCNSYGDCRRHAPNAMHFGITQIGNTIGTIAWAVEELAQIDHDEKVTDYRFEMEHDHWPCWARTGADEWCGDFVARKEPLKRMPRKAGGA